MPVTGGGDLRQSVTFAEQTEIVDEWGNTIGGWVDRFTARAQITPRLGGETVEAARLEGRQPVVIRIRQSDAALAVKPDWRATDIDSGVAYNIRAVADPELGSAQHGRWIDMLAESGVAI